MRCTCHYCVGDSREEIIKKKYAEYNDWTEEDIVKIAESMASPIRCGGTEYIDGELYYRIGGRLISSKDLRCINGCK